MSPRWFAPAGASRLDAAKVDARGREWTLACHPLIIRAKPLHIAPPNGFAPSTPVEVGVQSGHLGDRSPPTEIRFVPGKNDSDLTPTFVSHASDVIGDTSL